MKRSISGLLGALLACAGIGSAADLSMCLAFPSAGSFELWIEGPDDGTSEGIAGFTVDLSGSVTSFSFSPLTVTVSSSPAATAGFDVFGSGSVAGSYNIHGAQTPLDPNSVVFGVALREIEEPGETEDVTYGLPLLIGSGTYSGADAPEIDFATAAANLFDPAADGSTISAEAIDECTP